MCFVREREIRGRGGDKHDEADDGADDVFF